MTRINIPPPAQAASDVSGGSVVEELHLQHDDAELPTYYPAPGRAEADKSPDSASSTLPTDVKDAARPDEKAGSGPATDADTDSCAKETWEASGSESATERSSSDDPHDAGTADPPPPPPESGFESLLAHEFAAIHDEIRRDLASVHAGFAAGLSASFAGVRDELSRDFATIRQDFASALGEVRGDWQKAMEELRSVW